MLFSSKRRKNRGTAAVAATSARSRNVVERLEGRVLLSAQNWNWAAKQIGQDLAVANYPSLTGAGETVVIIDSGVDYKHPSLGGGIGANYKVVAGYDFMSGDADPFPDTFAHGTGSAGVVAANGYTVDGYYGQGIAPGVKLIALRQSNSAQVKQSLEWVLANRAKYNIVAVNMTDYGGGGPSRYADTLKQVIAAGIFVAHPSGNSGPTKSVAAAMDPADWSVGATNSSGAVAGFTQRGPELDLLAPGEHVTIPYWDVATQKHIYVDAADGTSWASPAVTGTAALIKQIDPRFTPAQIMKILQDSGESVYDSVSKLSYKRLNVNAALALAYQRKPGGGTTDPQAPLGSGPTEVAGAQSPFSGTRIRVGGGTATFQAEDFDLGGEGVAFHDAEAKNVGLNNYRGAASGVDIETTGTGGRDVGFTKAGEWMEYSVDVATSGTYSFTARVASLKAGGKFHVEIDGVDRTGQLAVPNTGRWQAWTTVTKSGLSLAAGSHVIRVKMDSVGSLGYTGNFDYFQFTQQSAAAAATTPAAATRSAFNPIAATSYTAQHGIVTGADQLDYIDAGDWVEYKGLDFGSGGAKVFSAGIAVPANLAGKKIQVRVGSPTGTVIGTLTAASTGSWTKFFTQSTSVSKVTGVQNVYLTFAGGPFVANVQWIKFS
jgi:hypothetical protein